MDEIIEVTILDTETGDTAKDNTETRRFWADSYGACDCNRETAFDRCLGAHRYLIIAASDGGDLRELNQEYPQKLVDRYVK